MNIASTNLIARDTKEDAIARVNAANNTASNGTNNNTNNNAVVAQPKEIDKPDTVEVSQKSVALAAAAARSDTSSNGTETSKAATTAPQTEPAKVEEATQKVTAAEKSTDTKINYRQAMKKSQHELRSVVKNLKEAGVGRREIGNIVRNANRQANKTIGTEMRQAYHDYRGKKINRGEFTNKLHGSAVKKLNSIVSALKGALAQKTAPADKNTEKVKELANATKSDEASGATKETRPTDADDAAKANAEKSTEKTKEASKADDDDDKKAAKEKEKAATATTATTTTSKLIIKEEKVVAEAETGTKIVQDDGSVDNTFSQIVDFFNDIDKMVNGFADEELEGIGSNGEDKGDSAVKFASKLSDMFSGINRAFGRHKGDNVGNRLGMAQMKKETISQLFDSGHGSGSIHSIGDAGEGSGNFNAVSFMSSMSNGINEGLNAYKEVQDKVEQQQAKEEAVQEEAVSAVA